MNLSLNVMMLDRRFTLAIKIYSMHNFRKLDVWKKSIQFSTEVYKFLRGLNEKDQKIFFGQLGRGVVSIPSNIAEGSGTESDKDFNRYLNISTGSAFEVETQLIILMSLTPEKKDQIEGFITNVQEIQRMIRGLKKSISEE